VSLSARTRQTPTVDPVYRTSYFPLRAVRQSGLALRIRDTAAFYQLLAFSSWHLEKLRGNIQGLTSLQFMAKANYELQKQIGDASMRTHTELVLAVLFFGSTNVRQYARAGTDRFLILGQAIMGNPGTISKVHLDGARRLIQLRGGLRSFENDEWARLQVFWQVKRHSAFYLPIC
jgi:hypothetical protein